MNTTRTCPECGSTLPLHGIAGNCPSCLLRLATGSTLDDEAAVPIVIRALDNPDAGEIQSRQFFGDYELQHEIARGGMGIVYRARQVSLNRPVALKMISGGHLAKPTLVRRFYSEAEATAKLDHPNIVSIYEIGEHEGQHYLSMRLVDGSDLARVLEEKKSSPGAENEPSKRPSMFHSPAAAAQLLATIARAIHYAHQRGVLHRDLKPTNILIDSGGVPHVTDFGLAKLIEEESSLTLSHAVLGTPSYMAPEQAFGQAKHLTVAADIYSLGAILYELLTGQPPFRAATPFETMRQVIEREPERPRSLNPSIPRDLEIICLTCLDKDPERRYRSAEVFADDLERFLSGRPILARSTTAGEKLWRWCRRNPVPASLAGLVSILLVTMAVGSTVVAWKIQEHRQQLKGTVRKLEVQRAEELFRSDNATEGLAVLASMLRADPADRAIAEWIVAQLTQRNFPLPILSPFQHPSLVTSAIFSPDGTRILTACRDNSGRLWDAQSGRLLHQFRHQTNLVRRGEFLSVPVLVAQFSPDGSRVVTGSIDRTARIWNAQTGEPMSAPLPHDHYVCDARFSSDGTRLMTASVSGKARVWNAETMQLLFELSHEKWINAAKFSPDGKRLLTASDDKSARLWDAQTGRQIGAVMMHRDWVRDAEFSPDGAMVITASKDKTARIWDGHSGEPITAPLLHADTVNSACFSPDGQWAATASFDKTARIWNVRTGQLHGQPLKHRRVVRYVQFSPEGERLVTASEDRTARIWDFQTSEPLSEPLSHDGMVRSAQFSPNGQRVVTAANDSTAQLWDVRPGDARSESTGIGARVRFAQFSPDGKRVVAAALEARVVEMDGGRPVKRHVPHKKIINSVRFSPDGKQIITASEDHTSRIQRVDSSDAPGLVLPHKGIVHSASFSPDGLRVVTASADKTAVIWNPETAKPILPALEHPDVVYTAEFSPDSRQVLTACADNAARLWEARDGRQLAQFQHDGPVGFAEFSPDGRSVVTASADYSARIWDCRTGAPLTPPLEHLLRVNCARFSPDSRRVITGSRDGTAKIWDIKTGRLVSQSLVHDADVSTVGFSPDGLRVVTGSRDGTARLWDAQTGQPLCEPLRHRGFVNAAEFSPDGRWVLTASHDHNIRLWEVFPVAAPIPRWLAELAEAIAGRRIDAEGISTPVDHADLMRLRAHLAHAQIAEPLASWGKWFFADRATRPLSPQAQRTLKEVRRNRY